MTTHTELLSLAKKWRDEADALDEMHDPEAEIERAALQKCAAELESALARAEQGEAVAWFDGFDLITNDVMQSRADGLPMPPRDLSKYRPLVYKESAK